MTVEEIIARAEKRFNSHQNRFGLITREDIIDFFKTLKPEQDRKTELTSFLEQIPYLTQAERARIYSDIESYT